MSCGNSRRVHICCIGALLVARHACRQCVFWGRPSSIAPYHIVGTRTISWANSLEQETYTKIQYRDSKLLHSDLDLINTLKILYLPIWISWYIYVYDTACNRNLYNDCQRLYMFMDSCFAMFIVIDTLYVVSFALTIICHVVSHCVCFFFFEILLDCILF